MTTRNEVLDDICAVLEKHNVSLNSKHLVEMVAEPDEGEAFTICFSSIDACGTNCDDWFDDNNIPSEDRPEGWDKPRTLPRTLLDYDDDGNLL